MSLSRRLCAALFLFGALGSAQKCYFPDGTRSTDTPCSNTGSDSACCGSSAFCLDNGLCFGGGVVTRGSCTDKSWESEACTGYCKTDTPHKSIPLTPCASSGGKSSFVCGLNSAACKDKDAVFVMAGGSSFVLRQSQVAALVEPVLSSLESQISSGAQTTITSCPTAAEAQAGLYNSGQMAGLAIGLLIPLLVATSFAFLLWRKEQARKPKLMYTLPDGEEFNPPPRSMHHSPQSLPASRDGSDVGSFRTLTPTSALSPASAGFSSVGGRSSVTPSQSQHLQTMAERYQSVNKAFLGPVAQELDGQPVGSAFRFETSSRAADGGVGVCRSASNNTNRSPRAPRRGPHGGFV